MSLRIDSLNVMSSFTLGLARMLSSEPFAEYLHRDSVHMCTRLSLAVIAGDILMNARREMIVIVVIGQDVVIAGHWLRLSTYDYML